MKDNNGWVILGLISITMGIVYLAYISFSTTKFKGIEKEGIVTLVEKRTMASGYAGIYTYECNGKQIEIMKGDPPMTAVIGEKYHVVYDSLDCENVRVLYANPTFTADERCRSTEGEVYQAISFFFEPFVKFKYSIKGKEFERFQHMDEGFKDKYPNIKNGAKFRVKYWINNPQRSIMYFDKE